MENLCGWLAGGGGGFAAGGSVFVLLRSRWELALLAGSSKSSRRTLTAPPAWVPVPVVAGARAACVEGVGARVGGRAAR